MASLPALVHDDDHLDYLAVLAEVGLSHADVRTLTESADDQIALPAGYAVEVRPSPIDGLGVFVTQPFQAGEPLAPARIGDQRTPVGRYTNHAHRPNCSMVVVPPGIVLVARQSLQPGDEATVDYRQACQAAALCDARQRALGPPEQIRALLLAFEAALAQHPEAVFGDSDLCPLTHTFGEGVYVREMLLPQGTMITGKLHRHAHPYVLLRGEVLVVSEAGGQEHLRAPLSRIAPPGTKRAMYALEDTVWITMHPNPDNTRDLAVLEAQIIAPDYEALRLAQAATPPEPAPGWTRGREERASCPL